MDSPYPGCLTPKADHSGKQELPSALSGVDDTACLFNEEGVSMHLLNSSEAHNKSGYGCAHVCMIVYLYLRVVFCDCALKFVPVCLCEVRTCVY